MNKTMAHLMLNEINTLEDDEIVAEVLWSDSWYGKFKELESEVVNTSRWYERVQTIYRFSDDSYLAIDCNHGLTEIQDDTPENAKAYLVEPYEVTVTKYRKVQTNGDKKRG